MASSLPSLRWSHTKNIMHAPTAPRTNTGVEKESWLTAPQIPKLIACRVTRRGSQGHDQWTYHHGHMNVIE